MLGFVIGTALGWSDLPTMALAIALAFLFGYSLTMLPLLRSGLALAAVVPLALASDTVSITVMEIVDNGLMLLSRERWRPASAISSSGAASRSRLVAGAVAYPVNRWLIARGKGHAVVHAHHGH